MKTGNFSPIDSLDIRIIELLELDSRQNYKDIAAKLGASRATITSRVQQLLDKGIINMYCWVNPVTMSYKFPVTLFISAMAGQINAVADRLKAYPQIPIVNLCTGSFDIFALGFFNERKDLSNFILDELDSIPGIGHVEKLVTLQEVKATSMFLTDEGEMPYQNNREKDLVNLDDLDVKLIRELQNNARQKTGYLVRQLGASQPTIYRRIKRLVQRDVIRMKILVDPFVVGYEGVAVIGLKCDPDKVEEVAATIASYKQALYVTICAGRYDIATWVMFRTLSDLRHFITTDIGCIPGLKDTETMISHKVVKMSLQMPM